MSLCPCDGQRAIYHEAGFEHGGESCASESLRKCDAADGWLAARRLAILHSSYTNTAGIEVHEGGTEGTIPTPGDRFAELRLLSAEGQPSVFWSHIDLKRVKW